ncbi:MAG: FAD binding domain-containing protein [Acidimicrobiia bacterium]|nr:FAD binding domain-containing protein [Acidimicrobiia bacterium]
MKPAAFAYHAPDSIAGAIELLSSADDAKILAGGQSLVPTMNFRLARPAALVDINRIVAMDSVSTADGVLEIGALARHASFESPVEPGRLGQILARVARFIGHHPIRIRGTFVGSLAHADPAAEWCVVARTLDAMMVAAGPSGVRYIDAETFFQTLFSTDLRPNEILTSVRLPLLDATQHAGFAEYARRTGDFALTMALVVLDVTDGVIERARIGLGGVADKPIRVPDAESAIVGMRPEVAADVVGDAAASSIVPLGDIHGSPEYRTDLIRAMVRRATLDAVSS